jgi:flagellar biosynthesis/type III secretory pathway M-ring protein FliF/YscJ
MIKAKLPSPETLNIGFINLLNNLPNNLGILVLDKSSVAIKKGKSDGITEVAHNFKPDFAAAKLLLENSNKHNVKTRKIIERKFLFILKTNIFIVFFFIWTPLINLYEDKIKIELPQKIDIV